MQGGCGDHRVPPIPAPPTSLHWGGWIRTTNLPVNSRLLCQLSYTPLVAPGRLAERLINLMESLVPNEKGPGSPEPFAV